MSFQLTPKLMTLDDLDDRGISQIGGGQGQQQLNE